MKNIQLNKIKYSVPTSWNEVTLERQIKVTEDSHKIIDNEVLQKIALVSGYCNIPIEVLKGMHINKIAPLFKHITFLNEKIDTTPIKEFEFKGEKYNVMETLLNGEFQDWVSIETAFQNHKEDSYNAIPIVIAVLAKRKGETLDDFDLMERAELFKQLPMTIVEPLKVFFSTIESGLSAITLLSLKENQELLIKEKMKELQSTLRKQDGGVWYVRLHRGILLRWVKYLDKNATSYFNTTQSKSLKMNWMQTFRKWIVKKLKRKPNKKEESNS